MPKPTTVKEESTQVVPEASLEKRVRRKFSAEYKLQIIKEAATCEHGELGALLRRENLYNNQLHQWRSELSEGGVESLKKTAPGPSAKLTQEQRTIAALEKENARLKHQLQLKDDCLELQKKALSMLERHQSEVNA